MAYTTSNAIKQVIETGGLGITAHRDLAPDNASYPYAIVHEGLSFGMQWIESGDPWVTEEVEIFLYQELATETFGQVESLVKRLVTGKPYPNIGTKKVLSVRVGVPARMPVDPGDTTVTTLIPLVITREI